MGDDFGHLDEEVAARIAARRRIWKCKSCGSWMHNDLVVFQPYHMCCDFPDVRPFPAVAPRGALSLCEGQGHLSFPVVAQ